jgi:hypothetical protein
LQGEIVSDGLLKADEMTMDTAKCCAMPAVGADVPGTAV